MIVVVSIIVQYFDDHVNNHRKYSQLSWSLSASPSWIWISSEALKWIWILGKSWAAYPGKGYIGSSIPNLLKPLVKWYTGSNIPEWALSRQPNWQTQLRAGAGEISTISRAISHFGLWCTAHSTGEQYGALVICRLTWVMCPPTLPPTHLAGLCSAVHSVLQSAFEGWGCISPTKCTLHCRQLKHNTVL